MADLLIENLKKSYGSTSILKGVSLNIPSGSFVSLLGPSGSGKTTILRCVSGLERPDRDSGPIRIGSEVVSGGGSFVPPERRRLGMVFQSYAVWPHLSVFENVAYPLRLRQKKSELNSEQVTQKTNEALELVKMSSYASRLPHQLSGGQQQRVAIARALAMSPEILLLDEPLSNLDALLREELGTEIRRLQTKLGLTAILVTHDQKEALSLSDQIVLLNQGRIEAQGTPEELYRSPGTEFTAEFIASAQRIRMKSGEQKQFMPRRWAMGSGIEVQIASRIFLGSEYEYWGTSEQWLDPVRFFGNQHIDVGQKIRIEYRA